MVLSGPIIDAVGQYILLPLLTYTASVIVKKAQPAIDRSIDEAYKYILNFLKERLGRDPQPEDFTPDSIGEILRSGGEEILQQEQKILALSPVLRRAQMAGSVLQGAQVLWVDDLPDNNIYEIQTLKALGVTVELALTTKEALAKLSEGGYDLVISDMKRNGVGDEGLKMLSSMKSHGPYPMTIFYVTQLDGEKGTPQGAFGITNRPDDLLNYVLDVLERERV